ncbi:DUF3426 domain-containing protein [Fodinicurvata halophila]|uniref:DUF3426 domain-containing protein n=1 Tax=Fodinicurvata halophila TaxID=1419723 RepID=A0ABV8UN06_9PROT
MILTCPSCQSRFRIPDGSLGTEGRRVRCGDCRHVWHAMPELAAAFPDDPTADSADAAAPAEHSRFAAAPDSGTESAPVSDASAWAPRPRSQPEQKPASKGLAIGWGLLVLVIAGLAAAGWFARSEVVATVPESRQIYDSLGIPLAAEDPQLALHDVVSLRRTVDGEEQLQVQGLVTNEGAREVAVPEMRAVIRDTDGSELHSWTFRPENERLAPGDSTDFSTSTSNPPDEGSLALIFLAQE